MTPSERNIVVEQVEIKVTGMMIRAGEILMEYVNGLDDDKLKAFVAQFNETSRTALLSELVKNIQRKEFNDATKK